MNRISIHVLILLIIISLLLLPASPASLTSSPVMVTLSGSVESNPAHNLISKAANTPLDTIKPGAASYQSNWASIMKDRLGLNTLRFQSGGEGDVWHINMVQNPSTWAVNLESLLETVDNAGLKCYFYALGDPWGGEFGINDPSYPNPINIQVAESHIDELAGNNSLGHNFISDPRIAIWSVSNEVDFGNPASPNSNYYWTIQMCDYIRSKGGLVVVPSPSVNGQFNDMNFGDLEPLLRGHVDYLEIHQYGIWQLVNQYSLGNQQYDWASWQSWLGNYLTTAIGSRGSFSINRVILGEFGIWRGAGTDSGLTLYNFTDQNRVDYYTHYFNVITQLGLENVCFHYSIEENSQYHDGYPRYGMITPVPDGIHFTGPAGQPYPGCEVIKSNFG